MIAFTYEGKDYEFRGETRLPKKGEDFLDMTGTVIRASLDFSIYWCAIVHHVGPFPKTYTFGVLKLEETGETRQLHYGDFFLEGNKVHTWVTEDISYGVYRALKPVEILEEA